MGQHYPESNISKLTHYVPLAELIPPSPKDLTVLQDHDNIKQLGNILKTNVRACTAVGHPFVIQVSPVSELCTRCHGYCCTAG